MYEKDYYATSNTNKPMPIRWMAVESMKEGMYSTKSDVVSMYYSRINDLYYIMLMAISKSWSKIIVIPISLLTDCG